MEVLNSWVAPVGFYSRSVPKKEPSDAIVRIDSCLAPLYLSPFCSSSAAQLSLSPSKE